MTMGLLGILGILDRFDTIEFLPWCLGAAYLGFVLYPTWTI
jgi:hypothetical protein